VTAKALQLKTYPGCGGSWFRIADFYRFYREETIGNFWETWPDLVGQASLMPMKIAVCLCGAPQMPNIGGVHWGHTPNAEISRLYESIQGAQQSLNGSAVSELASGSLAGKSDLSTLAERMKLLDKKMGKRVAQEDLKRKSPRGRYWAPPVGKPAAGNDRVLDRRGLAMDLQKCGFKFREARAIVQAILGSMLEELQAGGRVKLDIGTFSIARRPAPKKLQRFHRVVTVNQQSKRVVFRAGAALKAALNLLPAQEFDMPKAIVPDPLRCEKCGSLEFWNSPKPNFGNTSKTGRAQRPAEI
jgi:nucleoid DNA-binding protein